MIATKEKNFISAVVYVRNNVAEVVSFLQRINTELYNNFEKYEIICVNDCSTDQSVSAIKEYARTLDNCILTIVNMSYYQGVELSMNAGVHISIGDFVYQFDSVDIDYDPSVLMEIYKHALSGYDIVSASSNKKPKATSKLFYRIFNRNANLNYELTSERFLIISRRAINRANSMSKTMPYRKAIYANCGLKKDCVIYTPVANVPVNCDHTERRRTATNTLILFTDIVYKMAMMIAGCMAMATVAIAIYILGTYVYGTPVEGFTTIMLVMTGSFFGVFAILVFVVKYLSILLDLVFKKQVFIIESIEKVSK